MHLLNLAPYTAPDYRPDPMKLHTFFYSFKRDPIAMVMKTCKMEYVRNSNVLIINLAVVTASVQVMELHVTVMTASVALTVQSTLKVKNHVLIIPE